MLRLFDWQCMACGAEREALVDVRTGGSPQRELALCCESCADVMMHERLISMPARYMGDRVRNPCVTGGSFDTMGYSPVQTLPDLPDSADATLENYKQLWSSKDWQEKRALQREQNRKNAQKRKRAAALARGGTVNMRADRCDGDPKMET